MYGSSGGEGQDFSHPAGFEPKVEFLKLKGRSLRPYLRSLFSAFVGDTHDHEDIDLLSFLFAHIDTASYARNVVGDTKSPERRGVVFVGT